MAIGGVVIKFSCSQLKVYHYVVQLVGVLADSQTVLVISQNAILGVDKNLQPRRVDECSISNDLAILCNEAF